MSTESDTDDDNFVFEETICEPGPSTKESHLQVDIGTDDMREKMELSNTDLLASPEEERNESIV
ncbi:Hypothetical protein CINCED_3A011508 [Cinara cedri]|uniref:Uncharacterized protein n=1 Tax=Cinara cedri TaxID=506608 RepID=A0A5E4N9Z0_9HEMI|nr:Hypothetical protein CINCED_3A011508 [Cinara cedri]